MDEEEQRKNSAKVTVLWLEKSRAQRILWLLEEIDMPYKIEAYKRTSAGLAGEDLKKQHPLGKSPMVRIQRQQRVELGENHSSENEILLVESGTIVEYLSAHFGAALIPERWEKGNEGMFLGETKEYSRYQFYKHYAEGSLMGFMILQLTAEKIRSASVPFFLKFITGGIASKLESSYIHPNLALHFDFLEEQMKTAPNGGHFLCGDKLSGADILMIFPLEAAMRRSGLTKEKHPCLVAYVEQMLERPAYKQAVNRVVQEFGKYETVA